MIEEEDIPAEKHVQSLLVQTKAASSRGIRARPFEEYAAITTEVNVGPELQLPCDLWLVAAERIEAFEKAFLHQLAQT